MTVKSTFEEDLRQLSESTAAALREAAIESGIDPSLSPNWPAVLEAAKAADEELPDPPRRVR